MTQPHWIRGRREASIWRPVVLDFSAAARIMRVMPEAMRARPPVKSSDEMTAISEQPFPFSDLALARRLERAEARSNAEIVEARARLFPNSGARWIEVAGAYAMFDGVSSPCTQTFGLRLFHKRTTPDIQPTQQSFQTSP